MSGERDALVRCDFTVGGSCDDVDDVTEDEVVEAVTGLVAAGEYLDEIPGVPGMRLSGGGVFEADRKGNPYRRLYVRGSREHLRARQANLVERLPPLVPASSEAVEEAERVLGRPLPSLLRRLFLDVGNGGFGPGYGILGLRGGAKDDLGMTALDHYRDLRSERFSQALPEACFPLCHWGCAIYSFVDCSSPEGDIWACDPNPGFENDTFRQPLTLVEWFGRWIEGRLYQPALIEDPGTGEARPATDDDFEQWEAEEEA
jgi:hypothetical protein